MTKRQYFLEFEAIEESDASRNECGSIFKRFQRRIEEDLSAEYSVFDALPDLGLGYEYIKCRITIDSDKLSKWSEGMLSSLKSGGELLRDATGCKLRWFEQLETPFDHFQMRDVKYETQEQAVRHLNPDAQPWVRLKHKPSGISVMCGQYYERERNKNFCMVYLHSRLAYEKAINIPKPKPVAATRKLDL